MRRALLLLPFLLLPACGDDGEDAKAAYVSEASQVCEEAVAQQEALQVPASADKFAGYAQDLLSIVEEAEAELDGLTPPAEDRQELERRVLEPLDDVIADGRAFVAKVDAAGNDQAKLLALLSQRPTTDGVDVEYLREYGLDSCAEAVELAG